MSAYQPSPRLIAMREQEARIWAVRRRVERHWSRMKSVSPAMKRYLAERDIRAGLVAAGLPLPVTLSFDELVQRHVHWERRSPGHIKSIRDMPLRRAVIAALGEVTT